MSTAAVLVVAALSAVLSGTVGVSAGAERPHPAGPDREQRSRVQHQNQNQAQRSATRAVWPLDPRPEVVARFDPPAETWTAGHRGVDLLGSPGQPVRAALGGTVSFAGTIAGRGVVVVDHGGLRTTYEPVARRVHRGQPVTTGDALGTLQALPGHCSPRSCLHWGLRRGQEYLDPLSLLGRAPVVLLPPVDAP